MSPATYRYMLLVRILISKGAKKKAKNTDGNTAKQVLE
jgi:hypothetical protein